MTNHNLLKMRREEKKITEKTLILKILDMCPACTLAIHDERGYLTLTIAR